MLYKERPALAQYVWGKVRDEATALAYLVTHEWRLAIAIALFAIGFVIYLDPLPPSTIRVAKGQPNSGLEMIALKYREYLSHYGVRVVFVDSDGAPDDQRLVSEGRADVGFGLSGLPPAANTVYLGSVRYQPLWLFYRGPKPNPGHLADFLAGKRVSVGIPGSGSRLASGKALEMLSKEARAKIELVEWNNADTLAGLKSGAIDAAFLLASFDSGNTQRLLQNPEIGVYDFTMTPALGEHLRFVEPVTLPAGAVHFSPAWPPDDVHMVAATMTLIARDKLHPATQMLLLAASKHIAQHHRDVFPRDKGFPAFVDNKLTRSPVAERYYEHGAPVLWGQAPYWLASLFDRFWAPLLAIFALLYPALQAMPSYKRVAFDAVLANHLRDLRALEARFGRTKSASDLRHHLAAAQRLQEETALIRAPIGGSSTLSELLQAQAKLIEKIGAAMVKGEREIEVASALEEPPQKAAA